MSKRMDKNILTFLILTIVFLHFISINITVHIQGANGNPILNIQSGPVSGIKFTIDEVEHFTPWYSEISAGNHKLDLPITQTIGGKDYIFIVWISTIFTGEASSNLPLNVNITGDTNISIRFREKIPDKPRKYGYITSPSEIYNFYGNNVQRFLSDMEACRFQTILYADDHVDIQNTNSISYLEQIAKYCDFNEIELIISLAHNMKIDETTDLNIALDQLGYHPSITHLLIYSEWTTWNADYQANRQAYLDRKAIIDAHNIPNFGHWMYQRAEKYGNKYSEGITWLNSVNSTFILHHNFVEDEQTNFDREFWIITWVDNFDLVEKTFGVSVGMWIPEYFIETSDILRVIETSLTTNKAERIFFTGNNRDNPPPLPAENIAIYESIINRYPNVFIKEPPISTTHPNIITTTITTVISPPSTTITIVKPPTTIITSANSTPTIITSANSTPTIITTVSPPTTIYTTVSPPPKTITTVITSTKNPLSFIEINDIEIFLLLAIDVLIPILLYIFFIRRRRIRE